jgi:hypothetical protein
MCGNNKLCERKKMENPIDFHYSINCIPFFNCNFEISFDNEQGERKEIGKMTSLLWQHIKVNVKSGKEEYEASSFATKIDNVIIRHPLTLEVKRSEKKK